MSSFEEDIIDRLAAARIRLRFDKVAREVLDDMKAALAGDLPDGEVVLFTLTAPIRQSGKTTTALIDQVRSGFRGKEVSITIQENRIRVRRLTGIPALAPKVLGFVHNPDKDAGVILDLAEARLREA